ncbi:UDP-N-acetylmuramate dehydrogenase [Agromyces sp. MMS24-K17]|uniref:UDP-N-acetylmuramate dehydrogenase n=1 Tax=Agromyces sp. MMS24-K17 TaxID=3372850 RepID=UPI0037543188
MGDGTTFSELTTLRVGGPIRHLVTATTQRDLVDLVTGAWETGEPWMVLGGGSNLLAGDDGFDGTVVRIATRGIEVLPRDGGDAHEADATGEADAPADEVRIRVQAGEDWDDLVAWTVAQGFSGIEALSGIPGSVGAAPVQNIGAYGQELADSLVAIEFLDEYGTAPRRIEASDLELGYRTSVLKHGLAGVVVSVELRLHDTAAERAVLGEAIGRPVAYAQLAGALGVQLGDRVPLGRIRDAVLDLRRSKGMVLDAADADSTSAGSFFTNPIVTERFARTLPTDAPRWYLEPDLPDEVTPLAGSQESPLDAFLAHQASLEASDPEPTEAPAAPLVKLSAAWLIERAGVHRGFALPGSRAAISSKHTLALTNRGGATAEEVAQLARFVVSRVQAEFGILLRPEPVVIGLDL